MLKEEKVEMTKQEKLVEATKKASPELPQKNSLESPYETSRFNVDSNSQPVHQSSTHHAERVKLLLPEDVTAINDFGMNDEDAASTSILTGHQGIQHGLHSDADDDIVIMDDSDTIHTALGISRANSNELNYLEYTKVDINQEILPRKKTFLDSWWLPSVSQNTSSLASTFQVYDTREIFNKVPSRISVNSSSRIPVLSEQIIRDDETLHETSGLGFRREQASESRFSSNIFCGFPIQ